MKKSCTFKKINGIFHTLIEFELLNVLQEKISYSRTLKDMIKQIFHIKLKKAITAVYRKNVIKHKMLNIFLFWRETVVFIFSKWPFFDADSIGIWLELVHLNVLLVPFFHTVSNHGKRYIHFRQEETRYRSALWFVRGT